MKRILSTVVALAAVLSIGTVANAALYNYDLAANGSTVVTVSEYSPAPCPGGYPATCFVNPLSAGSSLTLDITGSSATIVSSNLEIDTVTVIDPALVITTDVTGTLTGGTGTLVGDDILWTSPSSYSAAGTLVCTGYLCPLLLSLNDGQVYDISVLNAIGGTLPVPNPYLGTWDLSGDLSQILGSTRQVTSVLPPSNAPTGWLVYGATDLGFPVPEPGSMALVLLGLGGLALRARKA